MGAVTATLRSGNDHEQERLQASFDRELLFSSTAGFPVTGKDEDGDGQRAGSPHAAWYLAAISLPSHE